MDNPSNAAITPRDRIDRVMTIIADELGPRLLRDRRLTSVEFPSKNEMVSVSAFAASGRRLDALACFHIIINAPRPLFSQIEKECRRLRDTRNAAAHNTRLMAESDTVRVVTDAVKVLQFFNLTKAAQIAARYRAGPTIRYVTALRNYLIGVAKTPDGLATYEQALDALSEAVPAITMNQFLRQLNVLAALQMILGEPQLCALVVLADTKIPGDGFYWTIDVAGAASLDEKRAAHAHEVEQVRRFDWRESDEADALPW
jgi:hypothetical protein